MTFFSNLPPHSLLSFLYGHADHLPSSTFSSSPSPHPHSQRHRSPFHSLFRLPSSTFGSSRSHRKQTHHYRLLGSLMWSRVPLDRNWIEGRVREDLEDHDWRGSWIRWTMGWRGCCGDGRSWVSLFSLHRNEEIKKERRTKLIVSLLRHVCFLSTRLFRRTITRVEWNVTGTVLTSSGDDGKVRLWKGE